MGVGFSVCVWSGSKMVSWFDHTQSNCPTALQPLKQLLATPPPGNTIVEEDIGALMLLLRADSAAYGFAGASALRNTQTALNDECVLETAEPQ